MAIREILTSDDPRLREQSLAVEHFGTPEVEELAVDLVHTMLHGERAAIGLAAPQIGVLVRAFAMVRAPHRRGSSEVAGLGGVRGQRYRSVEAHRALQQGSLARLRLGGVR